MWELYKGRDNAHDARLLKSIREITDLKKDEIAAYYFSWTGDNEDHRTSFLPGHWNWIWGGANYIAKSLKLVLDQSAGKSSLLIVGWSNGGATAYELACTLGTRHQQDSLLVTLDPVSWTTKPCNHYSNDSIKTPRNWITVFTESHLSERLKFGNIIALFGRAWDDDHLPSCPTAAYKLASHNHDDTIAMWESVIEKKIFKKWAETLKYRSTVRKCELTR